MYPPILHYTTTLRNPRKNASPSFFFLWEFPIFSRTICSPMGSFGKKSLKNHEICNNNEESYLINRCQQEANKKLKIC